MPLFMSPTRVRVPVQQAQRCDASPKGPPGEPAVAHFGPHCPRSSFHCRLWSFVLLSDAMASPYWTVNAQRARLSPWSLSLQLNRVLGRHGVWCSMRADWMNE